MLKKIFVIGFLALAALSACTGASGKSFLPTTPVAHTLDTLGGGPITNPTPE